MTYNFQAVPMAGLRSLRALHRQQRQYRLPRRSFSSDSDESVVGSRQLHALDYCPSSVAAGQNVLVGVYNTSSGARQSMSEASGVTEPFGDLRYLVDTLNVGGSSVPASPSPSPAPTQTANPTPLRIRLIPWALRLISSRQADRATDRGQCSGRDHERKQ